MLSTDNLVLLLRKIAQVSKDSQYGVMMDGEDIAVLEDAASYIEARVQDDTRQADRFDPYSPTPISEAQFWREHCERLINSHDMKVSLDSGANSLKDLYR